MAIGNTPPSNARVVYLDVDVLVAGGATGSSLVAAPVSGILFDVALTQSATSAATATVAIGGTNVTGMVAVAMGVVDQVFTAEATALNLVTRHSATNPVKVTFDNTGAVAAVFHATLGFIAGQ